MSDESRYAHAIGKSGAAKVFDVERGHVRRFAEATGDTSSGVPPTFAIALRAPDPRAELQLDYTKLLHGEQSLSYERPLRIGDRLTVQATIVEAYAKAGKAGVMDFLVTETIGRDDDGVVYRARATVVVRR